MPKEFKCPKCKEKFIVGTYDYYNWGYWMKSKWCSYCMDALDRVEGKKRMDERYKKQNNDEKKIKRRMRLFQTEARTKQ